MNKITIDELITLASESHPTCISLYTPMEKSGTETQQNPIRFKNLVRQAESQLSALGLQQQEAKDLLETLNQLDSYDFWQYQSEGLAIFLSPHQLRYYCVPDTFSELVVVGDRFHLKPLLPLLSGDGQFYILALSQNQVRFLRGTRFSIQEVELTEVPTSMAEALRYDDPEKSLQFHTEFSPASRGDRSAMFHGQGAGKDDHNSDLLRFFHQVNRGVESLMKTEEAPLILAAVDYLLPIYHQVSTYRHLLPDGITGNPETLTPDQLHSQAWQIVHPYFAQFKDAKLAHYRELQNTEKATNNLEQIVAAAYFQRVETLFVAVNQQIWGTFNPDAGTIQIHDQREPGDEDLLDRAALHTLMNGGTVFAVAPDYIPDHKPLVAILRY